MLSKYFRSNRAIGSKDRKFLGETVYGIIRWLGLIDYFCPRPVDWKNRVDTFLSFCPLEALHQEEIPIHKRVSFPKKLFAQIEKAHGLDRAVAFCLASNQRAPLTVRVNPLKTSREQLLEIWSKEFDVFPTSQGSHGISFKKRAQLLSSDAYREGLFEIQDEASQLVADQVEAQPGDLVLDMCAGSGGKSLAIAPKLEEKGQIFLYDIRIGALKEAKKRLARAGIQNSQIVSGSMKKLRGKMDWVLVDAPCSGSGTWRRNPEQKWKWSFDLMEELVKTQRQIVQRAISFLAPGGTLVFATCSVLPQENEEQIAYFEREFGLLSIKSPFSSFPTSATSMDGFFAASLKKPLINSFT